MENSSSLNKIRVVKSDGSQELFIYMHLEYACAGLDVDMLTILKDARLKLYDGAKSSDEEPEMRKEFVKLGYELLSNKKSRSRRRS